MLCVMCFRFLSGSREGGGSIVHTREKSHEWGSWILIITFENYFEICYDIDTWDFENYYMWCWEFKIENFVWKFTVLQVGIRSLVWGIRVHLRVYLNSSWGFEKVFHKINNFSKRVKGFEKDRKEQCVQSVSARTVISQNTLTLCVMIWYAC